MIELYKTFWQYLTQPTYVHQQLALQKVSNAKDSDTCPLLSPKTSVNPLSFTELVLLSWPFVIVSGLIEVNSIAKNPSMTEIADLLPPQFAATFGVLENAIGITTVSFTVIEVILFPLHAWIFAKFWKWWITLFTKLLAIPDEHEQGAWEVAENAIPTYALMAIPVVGNFLSPFFYIAFIYKGLVNNLCMKPAHALAVFMALFLFFISFILLYALVIGFHLSAA